MSLPCFLRMSWKYTILFTKDQVCLRLSLHIGLNLICSPSYLYVIPLPRRPGFGLNDLYWGKGWSDFGCFFPFPISKLSSPDLGDCGEKQGRQRSVEIIGHLLALGLPLGQCNFDSNRGLIRAGPTGEAGDSGWSRGDPSPTAPTLQ